MKVLTTDMKIFLNRFINAYVETWGLDTCLNIITLLNVDTEDKLFAVRCRPGAFKPESYDNMGMDLIIQTIESECGEGSMELLHEIRCYFVPDNIAAHKKIIHALIVEQIDVNPRSPKDLIEKFGEGVVLIYKKELWARDLLNKISTHKGD